MRTSLFQIVSALTAILVFITWIKPEVFKFLLDKGQPYPSQGRQAQHTALLISSWLVVYVAIGTKGNVPEWLFVGYMISWAGAAFGSIWLKLKGQREQQDGTVTTESSKTITQTTATTAKGESP